jgi:uncharacterized protein (DUF1501 family)
MHRRRFLEFTTLLPGLAAMTASGRAFAAPVSAPRFLLVFLRGGYDCANVLVPYASDFYYESRPTIAVARPAAAGSDGALALDTNWALAPALRPTLAPMYARNEVAFVPFAGTDDLSRSHFETQDDIERGQPQSGRKDQHSGFMARLSAMLSGKAAPMAFTDSLPLVFQGAADIPNISVRSVGRPAFDERQANILASMYEGHRLQPVVREGLELRQQVAAEFADDMQQQASRGAINARGFALEASRIARLMREQYRLGFVDIGDWDTHVNEGGAQGPLATRLGNLGDGLVAFAEELGAEWKNTVVVVVSEFGRTFRENGNRGTDHGHGSVYWVLGGGIHGGRIAGEQVRVEQGSLFQNRDFPVLNNYRSVLAGLFSRLWALSPKQLETVFPDTKPAELRLV